MIDVNWPNTSQTKTNASQTVWNDVSGRHRLKRQQSVTHDDGGAAILFM